MDDDKKAVSACSLRLADHDYIHTARHAVQPADFDSRGALLEDEYVE